MEDFLDNFFILIPIVIVVALRLFAGKKKQASGEAEPGPYFSRRVSPEEDPVERRAARGATLLGSFNPGVWPPVPPKREPPSFFGEAALAPQLEAEGGQPLGAAAGESLRAGPRQELPGTPGLSPGGGGVFSRLEVLPPLKRAVALAEVLGSPRGLDSPPGV